MSLFFSKNPADINQAIIHNFLLQEKKQEVLTEFVGVLLDLVDKVIIDNDMIFEDFFCEKNSVRKLYKFNLWIIIIIINYYYSSIR